MANIERDNLFNEEQDSSLSNSSSSSNIPVSTFNIKSNILRPPVFGSTTENNGKTNNYFGLKPSVLKPSAFSFGSSLSTNNCNTSDITSASGTAAASNTTDSSSSSSDNNKFSNPFLRNSFCDKDNDDDAVTAANKSKDKATNNDSKETAADPLLQLPSRSTLPKSNLFTNVKSTLSENSGFIFGQNVHERVTGETIQTSTDTSDSNSSSSGLLFSSNVATSNNSIVPSTTTNNDDTVSSPSPSSSTGTTAATSTGGTTENENQSQSLIEAARKYEESRAQKRKYDEVETVTGEEDERNMFESNCKLFAFVNSNWEERGHGNLRLNDKSLNESRVVFRQTGNLRVLINTKIWPGMIAEQSSQKSLRFTAMDSNGQVKVFLVMSRPDIITKLYNILTDRIKLAKESKQTVEENGDENDKSINSLNNNSKEESTDEINNISSSSTSSSGNHEADGEDGNDSSPAKKKQNISA
uniref:Putative ran binding protein 3 n=1 Tax=Corethrella appendiculata TaxID=1370023 RepID=U5ESF0_9DIPT